MLPVNVVMLAETLVLDILDDGIEFLSVTEHELAEGLSDDELRMAHQHAEGRLIELKRDFIQ